MKFWTILLAIMVVGCELQLSPYYLARRVRAWWQFGRR